MEDIEKERQPARVRRSRKMTESYKTCVDLGTKERKTWVAKHLSNFSAWVRDKIDQERQRKI